MSVDFEVATIFYACFIELLSCLSVGRRCPVVEGLTSLRGAAK